MRAKLKTVYSDGDVETLETSSYGLASEQFESIIADMDRLARENVEPERFVVRVTLTSYSKAGEEFSNTTVSKYETVEEKKGN